MRHDAGRAGDELMSGTRALRVVTYNVHKCRGLDGRVRPERIVDVLREVDADIVALQEVLCIPGSRAEHDQAHFIAWALGFEYRFGENRILRGGGYGNVVLSRWPLLHSHNHDISIRGREQRGCLRVDVGLGDRTLHVYNVHLGTSYLERRRQARRLLDTDILHDHTLSGPRVLLGDFNEWLRGLASRLLTDHFRSADARPLRRSRTFPAILPLLHLDHIYYDRGLELRRVALHRSRTALVASDHLPLAAELVLRG
jgi:endonuclease/exonuclease/phosphatase family metal-dependent hydrolase